jgi:predicted anti-sigma-YlaC factor YlaD
MLNCEWAEALIAREADGEATALDRERLDAHAAKCAGCRSLREANPVVKAVLARRVGADAPPAFAARVMARVAPAEPAGWLAEVDWRRWTEWMFPVAAALALVVVLAGNASTGTSAGSADETAGVEAVATTDESPSAGAQALSQDVSTEELLAAMLGAASGTSEGTDNGR